MAQLSGGGTANLAPIEAQIAALQAAQATLESGKQPSDADLTAIAAAGTAGFGIELLALATAAAGRAKLGLGSAATAASGDFDTSGAAAAAQAASQPLDADLTAVAALSTQTFGRSLLTQSSAAKVRETLELGTAALQASGAFDAAGAAAAAQAASQPLDSDLTAIAALATTVFGRELLVLASAAKAREAIETNSLLQFEETVWRQGMPEKFWPTLWDFRIWKFQASVQVAASVHLCRFKAPRNITARGLSFVTVVASTANDECAVVMKDETGKKTIASSGAVASKLNPTVARQDVDFTADVLLEAGKIYYPGFQYNTIGGTAATILTAETQNGNSVAGIFGTGPPNAYLGGPVTVFPWVGEPAFSIRQTGVFLIIRER